MTKDTPVFNYCGAVFVAWLDSALKELPIVGLTINFRALYGSHKV